MSCVECGSNHLTQLTEGVVCTECGTVADDLCMECNWNDHSEVREEAPVNLTVFKGKRIAVMSSEHKSLQEDYKTLDYIAQLLEQVDEVGVINLSKEYAKDVKRGVASSTRCKHKTYRGRQRLGVLIACWVFASKQYKREFSSTALVQLFKMMPNCANLEDHQCVKYCADGRRVVETILSEKRVLGFTDMRKYETYMMKMAGILKARKVHQYSLRLLHAVEGNPKGAAFLQAHTPENMAAALFHKASQVCQSTYIAPEEIVHTLEHMGHRICTTTMQDICKQIEDLFVQSDDISIERMLKPEDQDSGEKVHFTASVIQDQRAQFTKLLEQYNLL